MPLEQKPKIVAHQVKSGQYRNVHVDGAVGGPTPHGLIHFALYSEHKPIPTQMGIEVDLESNGMKDVPEMQVGREGLFRELEVGIYLSGPTARALATWLIQTADELQNITKERQ